MSLLHHKKTITAAVLATGAMDTSSGLLLMGLPTLALALMGVSLPPAACLVFIRFIGAFVFGVGALYLFAALRFAGRGDRSALVWVLGLTAWMRSVIFVFTAAAILTDALAPSWWSVPATDGLLALGQFIFIWKLGSERGGGRDGLAA